MANGGNGTRAALAAGYAPRSAAEQASRLLKRGRIARALTVARAGEVEAVNASAERIVLELARIAFLDPAAMFDGNGDLLPIGRMPVDVRRAISSFDVEERTDGLGRTVTTRKIRLAAKADALRLLAQIRGLLVERVQHEGPQSVTVTIGVTQPVTQAPALGAAGTTITLSPSETEGIGVVHPGNDDASPGVSGLMLTGQADGEPSKAGA